MDKKVIFQAAMVGALIAFAAVIVQAMAGSSLPQNAPVQPGIPMALEQFARASNEYPDTALGFFGADSLFILGYIMVFVGLYCLTAERARPFALLALGAGLLTGFFDASENAFFITYALGSKAGLALTNPDLPLIYIVTNLKWMASFATLFGFGLIFPRQNWLEWVIAGLMFLYALVGVLGVANPSLILVRGLFFLAGMPLFAWYFWQQSRNIAVH